MTDAVIRDGPGDGAVEAPATRSGRRLPFSTRTVLAVGGALALAAGGAIYLSSPKPAESTDAAYVQADSSTVAPKVRGLVSQVMVRHNQAVRAGDPLVRIDPEEFDARVAGAAADLGDAEAAAAAARATLAALDAEERLAAANVRAAQTSIRAADAERTRAEADRRRYDGLVETGVVARRDAEQVRATAIAAETEAQHSRDELDVSRDQAEVTRSKRATLTAGLARAGAAVAKARSALILARQDQGHSLIRAPIDGVVGDRQVEPGDYVQPGTRLLTIVPLRALYVTANFKETQTARMTVGQPATIRVDALPGTRLKGHVDSFAPGSGSQFALLPFEPGTGNFTKIVQRVPVRIRFDPGQPAMARLRPGLSTTVTVRLADAGAR